MNCTSEDKCLKVIMYLALNGIDPKKYGFEVDEHTFGDMRTFYESASLSTGDIDGFFSTIKRLIPDKIDHVFEGSRSFFEWFVDKDLYVNVGDYWSYRVIYNRLPYSLASIYDKIVKILKINIHPNNFNIKHFPYLKDLKYDYE